MGATGRRKCKAEFGFFYKSEDREIVHLLEGNLLGISFFLLRFWDWDCFANSLAEISTISVSNAEPAFTRMPGCLEKQILLVKLHMQAGCRGILGHKLCFVVVEHGNSARTNQK